METCQGFSHSIHQLLWGMEASKKRCVDEGEAVAVVAAFNGVMTYEWDDEACGYTSTQLLMFADEASALKELGLLAYSALWWHKVDDEGKGVPEELRSQCLPGILGYLRSKYSDDAIEACLPKKFKARLAKKGGFTMSEQFGAEIMRGNSFWWSRDSGSDWIVNPFDVEYPSLG